MDSRFARHLENVCRVFGIVPCTEPVSLPGGYVAYVHKIVGNDDVMCVAKTYDDTRPITQMIIPTLERLSRATQWLATQPGINGRIVAPLLSVDGTVSVREGIYTTVLFPFIDGVTPRKQPLTEAQLGNLVDTVARIHALDPRHSALAMVPREQFSPLWIDEIEPALHRIAQPNHPINAVLHERCEGLRATFSSFRELCTSLARIVHPFVLCHTDIHGHNVVIRDDIPLLIDWEGMIIAPPEHDLMFWTEDNQWPVVWKRYQLFHPNATIDPRRLRYYQMRRHFEDLIQDIQRIEREHPDAESMSVLLESIDVISTELIG